MEKTLEKYRAGATTYRERERERERERTRSLQRLQKDAREIIFLIKFRTHDLSNILFFQQFRNQTRNTRPCADPRIFFPPPPPPLVLYFVTRFASNDASKHRVARFCSLTTDERIPYYRDATDADGATREAAVSDSSGSISHFRNSERIRRFPFATRPRASLRDREMEEASGDSSQRMLDDFFPLSFIRSSLPGLCNISMDRWTDPIRNS